MLQQGNGQGGWITTQYQYAGAATDLSGRGAQGFATMTTLNPDTGIQTYTQFSQNWPTSGIVLASRTVASQDASTIISVTNNTLTSNPFPHIAISVSKFNDLAGQDLGTTWIAGVQPTAGVGYDARGNLTNQTTWRYPTASGIGNAFIESITKTYNTGCVQTNSNFLYDRVCDIQTTKANPGGTGITREVGLRYDSLGALISKTVSPGVAAQQLVSIYAHDVFGHMKQETQSWTYQGGDPQLGPTNRSQRFTYDAAGRFVITSTDWIGLTSNYIFDHGTGAMRALTDQNSLTTSWTVDGFGRRLSETLPDGNQTFYYFNQCGGSACPPGFAVAVSVEDHQNAGSHTAEPSISYVDNDGHILRKQTTGFDGARTILTDFNYDQQGRLFSTTQPYYQGDPIVTVSLLSFDHINRVIDEARPDKQANCNVPSTVNAANDGCAHTWTQFNGLVRTSTNAKAQQRIDSYDVLGQVVSAVIHANDGVTPNTTTLFSHDSFGNLIQTIDPNNNVIIVGFDSLGRKTSLKDPDLGQISYSVDPLGRTWQQISPIERASGHSTTFQFDLAGRQIGRLEPDLTSTWIYDTSGTGVSPLTSSQISNCQANTSCGRLVERYTGAGVCGNAGQTNAGKDADTVFRYDNLGHPTQTIVTLDPLSNNIFSSLIQYDIWSRPVSYTYTHGVDTPKLFGQRYNSAGYLYLIDREFSTSSGVRAQNLWQATNQDAANRVLDAVLGNGLHANRCYDANTARLNNAELTTTVISCAAFTTGVVLQEAYMYDSTGNVTSRSLGFNNGTDSNIVTSQSFSELFSYDGLNRIASSVVNGQAQNFYYDLAGNLTGKTGVGSGAINSYHYPTQGNTAIQPHAVSSIDGVSGAFGYDTNGNQLNGFGRNTSWTSFDMPSQIQRNGNGSSFTYGTEHERVTQRTSNGNTTYYGGRQEVQVDSSATVQQIKTYWPNGLGVEVDRPSQAQTKLNWTHADNLGSVIGITDIYGTLTEAMGFDAWGSRRNPSGTIPVTSVSGQVTELTDDKGFTGQEMLDSLALVHLNGRVYDPLIGKFLSADPLISNPMNGQNYNRYSYVMNNPTNFTDPTGFCESVTGSNICFKNPDIAAGVTAGLGVKGRPISVNGDKTDSHGRSSENVAGMVTQQKSDASGSKVGDSGGVISARDAANSATGSGDMVSRGGVCFGCAPAYEKAMGGLLEKVGDGWDKIDTEIL